MKNTLCIVLLIALPSIAGAQNLVSVFPVHIGQKRGEAIDALMKDYSCIDTSMGGVINPRIKDVRVGDFKGYGTDWIAAVSFSSIGTVSDIVFTTFVPDDLPCSNREDRTYTNDDWLSVMDKLASELTKSPVPPPLGKHGEVFFKYKKEKLMYYKKDSDLCISIN